MTMTEFISILGLAVAVAQLVATMTPGRRLILFTGAAVLIGGEVNAELEHEAAQAGVTDAKEKGEKTA